MSSTERAAYRPSSGWDPPSNLTRGRYNSSRPPEITDDSLPEFLSEFHGYPFERINGRKRSRVLKPALIIGLLVSAFAILLTTFDSNDFRVVANKTKVAVDGATKDIRAKLTASNPMATNSLPPAVTEDAHATVGAASRGAGLIENRPLPIPPVNTEQEGPPRRLMPRRWLHLWRAPGKCWRSGTFPRRDYSSNALPAYRTRRRPFCWRAPTILLCSEFVIREALRPIQSWRVAGTARLRDLDQRRRNNV